MAKVGEENRYNNNEINLMLGEIKHTLNDQNKSLGRIETQTTKTNGRVSKLERNLMIVACIAGTAVLIKFPELWAIITKFI